MDLEKINSLTVENSLYTLLDRILDLTSLPKDAKVFMLNEDENMSFYDRVIVHQTLVKPPLETINAELAEYKAELTAIEQARLAEIARIEDIKTRFNALPDIRGVFSEASLNITNPALELKRIIDQNDQNRLQQLESASASFQQKVSADEALQQEIAISDSLVETCLGCIKIVMRFNIRNSLSKAQKDQQATTYADIFSAFKDWRPGKAKSLITAITPDGTLINQSLKDELVAYLTSKGI